MIDFSHYKAFLFDVDKTLTNSHKEITARTRQALGRLRERNLALGLCTGRHFATLTPFISIFDASSVHIVSGGAQVIGRDGDVLWQEKVSADTVAKIIELASKRHAGVVLQEGTSLYANEKKLEGWKVDSQAPVYPRPVSEFPPTGAAIVVVDSIDAQFATELNSREDCSVKLMRYYDGSLYADITARGVSKATGVQRWSQMSGIALEDVVGFGDSENDIEFLRSVGYAVAMGNASESVKMIAKEVTADCDHDGVASWIEKNIQ